VLAVKKIVCSKQLQKDLEVYSLQKVGQTSQFTSGTNGPVRMPRQIKPFSITFQCLTTLMKLWRHAFNSIIASRSRVCSGLLAYSIVGCSKGKMIASHRHRACHKPDRAQRCPTQQACRPSFWLLPLGCWLSPLSAYCFVFSVKAMFCSPDKA